MAIYKQVMPERNVNEDQVKEIETSNQQSDASVQMRETDEAFEYFSDKEEAEKHRKIEKKPRPQIL